MHASLKDKFFDYLRSRDPAKDILGSDSKSALKFKAVDLKKIRRKFNLSQRCFATMLDMSVKTLQNYEIDRTSIPGAARSLFTFADENIDLFQKHYLKRVDHLESYRDSMNGR